MNLEEIIILIFGSSLIATLTAKIWESIEKKKTEEKERIKKLYGPLKFYLLLSDLTKANKEELMADREPVLHLMEPGFDPYIKNINALIKKQWEYLEEIRKILESNPGYIKKEHFPLVKDFIDGYIKREIIGKDANKGDRLTNDERLSKILNAVDALKKEILNTEN